MMWDGLRVVPGRGRFYRPASSQHLTRAGVPHHSRGVMLKLSLATLTFDPLRSLGNGTDHHSTSRVKQARYLCAWRGLPPLVTTGARPEDLGTLDGSRGGPIIPRRVKAALHRLGAVRWRLPLRLAIHAP